MQDQQVVIPIQESPPGDDFWKWAFDDDNMILEWEHKMRGEMFNIQSGRYITKYRPLMNEEGIMEMSHTLALSVPNKSFKLTDLSEDDINMMAYEFSCSILTKLCLSYRRYGITTTNMISGTILIQIDHLYYSLLRRSKDNSGMRGIRETMHRQESHATMTQNQPKSGWGLFGSS